MDIEMHSAHPPQGIDHKETGMIAVKRILHEPSSDIRALVEISGTDVSKGEKAREMTGCE